MPTIVLPSAPDSITNTFGAMLAHTGALNPVVFGSRRPKDMLNDLVSSEVYGVRGSEYQPSGFMKIDHGSLQLIWTVLTDGTTCCAPFLVSGIDSDRGGARQMMLFVDSLKEYAAQSNRHQWNFLALAALLMIRHCDELFRGGAY
ncbi:hypothetical protein [Mycobacterium sp. URHB0021]